MSSIDINVYEKDFTLDDLKVASSKPLSKLFNFGEIFQGLTISGNLTCQVRAQFYVQIKLLQKGDFKNVVAQLSSSGPKPLAPKPKKPKNQGALGWH